MRYTKLMLVALMALAMVGTAAACSNSGDNGGMSGSAVGDPGSGGAEATAESGRPGEPGQPGSQPGGSQPGSQPGGSAGEKPGGSGSADAPTGLMDALDGFKNSERLSTMFVLEACGESATCLEELDRLNAYIKATCVASPTDCPDKVAVFTEDPKSSARTPADLPASFPRAADVRAVAALALATGAGSGDEPKVDSTMDAVTEVLDKYEPTDRIALVIVVEGCGADTACVDDASAIEQYIKEKCAEAGANCPAGIDGFLNQPTPEEIASGVLSDSFPTVDEVRELIEQAKESAGG